MDRGPAKEFQNFLNQDFILRILLKKAQYADDTVIATQEFPIAMQDEKVATGAPY